MTPTASLDVPSWAAKAKFWDGPLQANFVSREACGPLCWNGALLVPDDYVISLTEQEVQDLEFAAAAYADTGAPLGLISPQNFVLPVLGPRLLKARHRLYDGIGFFVLRGLSPRKYTNMQNTIIYAGLSSYVAERRAIQYEGGPVMTHVVDLSAQQDLKRNEHVYVGQANRNVSLPFHSDDGHILALYSLHSACEGGRSRLASSWTVVNELSRTRPDVIEILEQPWEWDSYGTRDLACRTYLLTARSFRPEQPKFSRPLLFQRNGKVILNFTRRHFLGSPQSPRNPDLTRISSKQVEALDLVEDIAAKHALTFDFQTGDIQFVNNLAILHGRESFVNSDLNGCRRHLVRLFLKDPKLAWPVPNELSPVMDRLYNHDAREETFPWTLDPLPYVLTP